MVKTTTIALAAAGAIVLYAGITGQSPSAILRSSAGGKAPAAASDTPLPAEVSDAAVSGATAAATGTDSGAELSGSQLQAQWGKPGSSQVTVNFQGHLLQFHSGGPADALRAVSAAITAAHVNYRTTNVSTLSIRGRTSDPSDLSYHAFGLAIDINPQSNPYVASGAAAAHDMPSQYVQIFTAHGFVWGGNWSKPKDYMHFEYHGGA
jgi:hypothetical protein